MGSPPFTLEKLKEAWRHSQYTVTWLQRMELVWQSSVTTVRAEQKCVMVSAGEVQVATHVTPITQERVSLNWLVSPEYPHPVNSSSSMNVTIQGYSEMEWDGGCHVILLRWRTGEEHLLEVVSAHAGWPTHAQTPAMVVTVIRMTMCGAKTAVSWLTRQNFLWNSSGLETQGAAMAKASIR